MCSLADCGGCFQGDFPGTSRRRLIQRRTPSSPSSSCCGVSIAILFSAEKLSSESLSQQGFLLQTVCSEISGGQLGSVSLPVHSSASIPLWYKNSHRTKGIACTFFTQLSGSRERRQPSIERVARKNKRRGVTATQIESRTLSRITTDKTAPVSRHNKAKARSNRRGRPTEQQLHITATVARTGWSQRRSSPRSLHQSACENAWDLPNDVANSHFCKLVGRCIQAPPWPASRCP